MTTIWIDGKYCDRDTAMVSVFDHGLLYGDGVFEWIRTYSGKAFRLGSHLDRLYDSAKAMALAELYRRSRCDPRRKAFPL